MNIFGEANASPLSRFFGSNAAILLLLREEREGKQFFKPSISRR